MFARLEGVADTLRSFPLGFLSKKLDVTKFTDVAHVRSSTRTHIDAIANLNDAKFLHARWDVTVRKVQEVYRRQDEERLPCSLRSLAILAQ